MGRTACTEPQCLYKGALYPFIVPWTSSLVRFIILRAVSVTSNTKFLLDVIPRNVVDTYQLLRGICCLHSSTPDDGCRSIPTNLLWHFFVCIFCSFLSLMKHSLIQNCPLEVLWLGTVFHQLNILTLNLIQ